MNKNDKISFNLAKEYNNIYSYLESTSFEDLIEKEIDGLNSTKFIPLIGKSEQEMRAEVESELNQILADKELIKYFEHFHRTVDSIDPNKLKETLKQNLISSFNELIDCNITNKKDYPIGIIFLDHNYDYIGLLSAFGKGEYDFPILESPKDIEFDFRKEIVFSFGKIDLSLAFESLMNIEKDIGEISFNLIQETVSYEFDYRRKLDELFLLYAYKSLNEILLDSKSILSNSSLELEEEVFVFAGEHDCEKRNIGII